MPKSLSNAALEAYRNDGYYFPLAALSSNEVAHVRTCLEEHETKTGGPLQGNFRHKAHLLFTWVDELVHHPKIVDAAEKKKLTASLAQKRSAEYDETVSTGQVRKWLVQHPRKDNVNGTPIC